MTTPTAPPPPRQQHQPSTLVDVPARRRTTARDAVRVVLVALALLVVFGGNHVERAAEDGPAGIQRTVLTAVGVPTGWIADHLPFAAGADQVAGWIAPSDGGAGGSADGTFALAAGSGGGRVSPGAFDPAALGAKPAPKALRTLLVTGDSMAQPLDAQLARNLASAGVKTTRDAHLGSGITKPFIVDWGKLAAQQAAKRPDAAVIFLGANDAFSMPVRGRDVECCSAEWAAEYATRARSMMSAFRQAGTKVYWVLLPAPKETSRAKVARAVNAAVRVAAGAFGAQVTVVDAAAIFTPGFRYRSAMDVAGEQKIVRRPDGIHLNDEGATILGHTIEAVLRRTFTATEG